jgi:transposase
LCSRGSFTWQGERRRGRLADRARQRVCSAVESVAIDPYATYRRAVAAQLPQATMVVDHFHLVQLANQAVTEVRRRRAAASRTSHGRVP